jgi:hypothetical protein
VGAVRNPLLRVGKRRFARPHVRLLSLDSEPAVDAHAPAVTVPTFVKILYGCRPKRERDQRLAWLVRLASAVLVPDLSGIVDVAGYSNEDIAAVVREFRWRRAGLGCRPWRGGRGAGRQILNVATPVCGAVHCCRRLKPNGDRRIRVWGISMVGEPLASNVLARCCICEPLVAFVFGL